MKGCLKDAGCFAIGGVIAIVVVLAFVFSGSSRTNSTARRSIYNPTSKPTIRYEIKGTARTVDLTYNNEQGGTEQISEARVPWAKAYFVDSGFFGYISAQNQGRIGTVTCEIWLDGKKVRTSTSSGAFVIATCSGRVP